MRKAILCALTVTGVFAASSAVLASRVTVCSDIETTVADQQLIDHHDCTSVDADGEAPEVPEIPGVPGVPAIPGVPSVPGVPSLPPAPPCDPTTNPAGCIPPAPPGLPPVPGIPAVPGVPS
ncbi:MAG: hypothetical protein ACRDJM_05165, partial [Actinomycetota bacterium]